MLATRILKNRIKKGVHLNRGSQSNLRSTNGKLSEVIKTKKIYELNISNGLWIYVVGIGTGFILYYSK